jgi:hypothetical protein
MAIHVYHPSKSLKGFAASFWYSDRNDTVFATLIKQHGWDDASKTGTFKGSLTDPTKKVNVKLAFVEAAAILDCIERQRPFSAFHDNEENPKTIKFEPWLTNGDNPIQKGFSFSITVKSKQDTTFTNPFYIGLTFAEAREIREFLIFVMHEHFARDLNRAKEYAGSRPEETLLGVTEAPSNEAIAVESSTDELTGL